MNLRDPSGPQELRKMLASNGTSFVCKADNVGSPGDPPLWAWFPVTEHDYAISLQGHEWVRVEYRTFPQGGRHHEA